LRIELRIRSFRSNTQYVIASRLKWDIRRPFRHRARLFA
jgi:hypothetical protein